MKNERECKIMLHKFQRYKNVQRKNASHGLTTLTSFANAYRDSAAAFAATSSGEMPWYATSIAINRTVNIRALAPKLAGTVATLKPRLFTLDSLEKRRGLLCNLALTGSANRRMSGLL